MAGLNKGRFPQSKDAYHNPTGGNQQFFEPFDLSSSFGKALTAISIIIFSAPAYYLTVIIPAMIIGKFIPLKVADYYYHTTDNGILNFLMFVLLLIFITIIAPAIKMRWIAELYLKYIISVFYAIILYGIIIAAVFIILAILSPLYNMSSHPVKVFFTGKFGAVLFTSLCIKIWMIKFPRQK